MIAQIVPLADGFSALHHCPPFTVGGISLQVNAERCEHVAFPSALEPFCYALPERPAETIAIDLAWAPHLAPWPGTVTFDSGAVWKLFRDDSGFIFEFTSSTLSDHPYKRLQVDRSFRSARLTLNREVLAGLPVFPLEYPADELLVTNSLAHHGTGIEVHGCGLIDPEAGGQLFLGHSGAGKSTTTRVWDYFRSAEILSDDRIILRLHDGELWMYGTPWHGDAQFASPGRARISRIFVLRHGRSNLIRHLPKARALAEMFARSFPPFHSAAGLERTIEFLNHTLQRTPCYEFEFVPDRSSVEEVLAFHG